jgi:phosphoribosyl-ATP pyrophosphohydrolase
MAKSAKKRRAAPDAQGRENLHPKPRKKALKPKKLRLPQVVPSIIAPPESVSPAVLERLHAVVQGRVGADPSVSHSARLLSRGLGKVAQKFGEEAVECLIEAVAGNREAVVAESADVLYHLIVLWVASGVAPGDVWAELVRREGISGIAEKASRPKRDAVAIASGTTKIP